MEPLLLTQFKVRDGERADSPSEPTNALGATAISFLNSAISPLHMSIENIVPVPDAQPNNVVNGTAFTVMEVSVPDVPETDEEHIARLENEMTALPIVNKLRNDPDITEVVAYGHLTPTAYEHSLTASTLRGRGKIAVRPLKFFNQDRTECYMICHLGRSL
jgi:hypothetical protein